MKIAEITQRGLGRNQIMLWIRTICAWPITPTAFANFSPGLFNPGLVKLFSASNSERVDEVRQAMANHRRSASYNMSPLRGVRAIFR